MKNFIRTYFALLIALIVGNLLMYSYDIVTDFQHEFSHISKDGFVYVMSMLPFAALILTPFYNYIFKYFKRRPGKEDNS